MTEDALILKDVLEHTSGVTTWWIVRMGQMKKTVVSVEVYLRFISINRLFFSCKITGHVVHKMELMPPL